MRAEELELLSRRLPAQPGLLGKDEYRNAAVLMLLLLQAGEYHFILTERHPEIPQGGEICFPGGLFDPSLDASLERAAIRETVEELGLPEEKIAVAGALGTLISSLGTTVDAFVGVAQIRGLDELRVNEREVHAVFTIPVSRFEAGQPEEYQSLVRVHPSYIDTKTGQEVVLFPARELGVPERYTRPWDYGRRRILVYRIDQRLIWGITARLIYELVQQLQPDRDLP
jgi:8-oxo-dGTP pyrophosphatase MutT (NUDIX family)